MTNGYMKLFSSFITMLALSALALFVVLRFSGTEAPPEPAPIPVATAEVEEAAEEEDDLIPVLEESPLEIEEVLEAEVDAIEESTAPEDKTEVEIAADPDVSYLPNDVLNAAPESDADDAELALQDDELSISDDEEFVFEPEVTLTDAELQDAYAMEMEDATNDLVAEEEEELELSALPLDGEFDVVLEEEDAEEVILTVADAVAAANQLVEIEEEIVFDSNDLADYEVVEVEDEIVFDSNDLNDYEVVDVVIEDDEIVFDSNDLADYEVDIIPADDDEIVFDSNDLSDYEADEEEIEEEFDALIDELAIEEAAFDESFSDEIVLIEESEEDDVVAEDVADSVESTIVIAQEEDFYDVSDLIDDSNLLGDEEESVMLDAASDENQREEVEETEETDSGEIIFDSNDLSYYGIVLNELDAALNAMNAESEEASEETTDQENADQIESSETAQIIFDSTEENSNLFFSQSDADDLSANATEDDSQESAEERFAVADVTEKSSEMTADADESHESEIDDQDGNASAARDSYDPTVIVEPTCAKAENRYKVSLVSYEVLVLSQEPQPLEGQSDLLSQRPELKPDKYASEFDSASLPSASEDSASLNELQVGEDVNPSAEDEGFAVSGAQQHQTVASELAPAQQVARAPLSDEVWIINDNFSNLNVWKSEANQWRATSLEEFYATDAQERTTIFWAHGYQTDMSSALNAAYVFRDTINRARRATGSQRSYRLVIWKWASERHSAFMRMDANNKIHLANMTGANLASVVAKMNAQDDVTFVGFSFGACVVGRALQNLAFSPRTSDKTDGQNHGRISLVLVCAACDLGSFDYYGQYANGAALPNCVVNLYNPIDNALHFYPWASDLSASAQGVAPVQGQTFPNSFGRIYNINVSTVVAKKHSFIDTINLIPNDLLASVAL